MTWTSPVARTCQACGEPFLASVSEVNRGNAKVCSRACAANFSKPANSREGHSRTATRRRARKIWIERHGGAEPICHCGKSADVHHRDGNPLNNAPDNQEPLCRSHHTQLHNRLHPRRRKAA